MERGEEMQVFRTEYRWYQDLYFQRNFTSIRADFTFLSFETMKVEVWAFSDRRASLQV